MVSAPTVIAPTGHCAGRRGSKTAPTTPPTETAVHTAPIIGLDVEIPSLSDAYTTRSAVTAPCVSELTKPTPVKARRSGDCQRKLRPSRMSRAIPVPDFFGARYGGNAARILGIPVASA